MAKKSRLSQGKEAGKMEQFPEVIQKMFSEAILVKSNLMYKVMDRTDEQHQGLYKKAESYQIHRKGLSGIFKEKLRPGDVMLIRLDLGGVELKACSAILASSKIASGDYDTELEFIILTAEAIRMIDHFISQSLPEDLED